MSRAVYQTPPPPDYVDVPYLFQSLQLGSTVPEESDHWPVKFVVVYERTCVGATES